MSCKKGATKRLKQRETASESDESNNIQKTKHACIVEAHESTRKRLEPTLLKDHERHIAGNRENFDKSVHKKCTIYSEATSNETSGCERRSGQKIGRSSKSCQCCNLIKVLRKKVVVILEAQREKKKVHFASLIDSCHFKKCGDRPKIPEV